MRTVLEALAGMANTGMVQAKRSSGPTMATFPALQAEKGDIKNATSEAQFLIQRAVPIFPSMIARPWE